jgi:hypothetical protein
MLYVPALFWTHLLAFWLLLRPGRAPSRSVDAANFARGDSITEKGMHAMDALIR